MRVPVRLNKWKRGSIPLFDRCETQQSIRVITVIVSYLNVIFSFPSETFRISMLSSITWIPIWMSSKLCRMLVVCTNVPEWMLQRQWLVYTFLPFLRLLELYVWTSYTPKCDHFYNTLAAYRVLLNRLARSMDKRVSVVFYRPQYLDNPDYRQQTPANWLQLNS